MQVILDYSFARPGLAPIWGVKKGEFRDWTKYNLDITESFAYCMYVIKKKMEMVEPSLDRNAPYNQSFFQFLLH